MSNKLNVLVAGSSGFIGQHTVKLLQEKDESVQSIICFDLKPYVNKLDHKIDKPMKIIEGDVRSEKDVEEALKGVDCIINCASYFCIDLEPDLNKLNSTNVDGTQNLINCAINNNVRYFVQLSTVDIFCGSVPIYYGNEATTTVSLDRFLDPYAKSKLDADTIVTNSNGTYLKNGTDKLRTAIIQPTMLYGEADEHFVTNIIKLAKECGKCLPRVDNVYIRSQFTYAGNVAWACIKAKDRLTIDESIGGEQFFITDDTEINDPFDFVEPYLNTQGLKISQKPLPFWLLYFSLSVFFFFVEIIKPFYHVKVPEKYNLRKIQYLTNTYFFNRNKAVLRLDYEPLYDPNEAKKLSLDFYSKLNIDQI